MNKELKEYLDKEFKIIFKDFRLRLNDLEKIKNKIYSSGYSKNLPVYLGKIPKFKGSQRELFSCFSYNDIQDIYEENKQLMFDILEIDDVLKMNYPDYPINDIRFLTIALNSIELSNEEYRKFLKYILSLIRLNSTWHVNMFKQNYVIERELASLITASNSVYDEYLFAFYFKEWALSLFKDYPYVLDREVIESYFKDNTKLLNALIELQNNQDYYLNGNTELRSLNNVLAPLVAKALEEKFKYIEFKDNNDLEGFMNEVRMTLHDELGIEVYEARCRHKMALNKNLIKKLKLEIKRSDN